MLSVQTAGCAGMERLGVPTRTTLNNPPDDRGQFICRMHIDAARDLLGVRNSDPVICGSNTNSRQPQTHQQQQQQQQNNHNQHYNSSDQAHLQQQQHQNHHHKQHHHHQLLVRHRTVGPTTQSPKSASHPTSASVNSGNNSISNNNLTSNNSNNYNNNLSPMTNNTDGNSGLSKGAIPIVSSGGNTAGHTNAAATPNHSAKLKKMCCVGGNSSDGGSTLSACCSSIDSQCSLSSHSHDHHQHYQHQLQQQRTLCCPHHVPLPDSEWIPTDQRLGQMRSSYQHSELTRSYIKPPPNKTVKDVPDRSSYNFYSSVAHCSNSSGLHSLTSSQSLPLGSSTASMASSGSTTSSSSSSSGGGGAVPQTKSKPNVITKFFYRKSSPKSPSNVATSSTASLASTTGFPTNTMYSLLNSSSSSSSSAMSLGSSNSSLLSSVSGNTSSTMSLNSQTSATTPASALKMAPLATLPVSTAATLKTTPCDYGPTMQHNSGTTGVNNISIGLVPSTQLLTTIGVSHPTATITTFPHTNAMERIPTPPLSVTVPISNAYHHQQQQQHQQQQRHQQQQLLLDCLVGDSVSVSSTLQTIKSSSCSPTISANAFNSNSDSNVTSKDDSVQMECQSGNITRNNSSSSMQSLSSAAVTATPVDCNCQHPNCKYCRSTCNTTSAETASQSTSSNA
ncbi:mucin-2 [Musca vetustissima]|uniref:mucin-2 n=1 Tax=Musca vetustissima TaxID=27455 RepID=UPI002AB7DE61|nr:mucin-2 [Musca vetustissima]